MGRRWDSLKDRYAESQVRLGIIWAITSNNFVIVNDWLKEGNPGETEGLLEIVLC